MAVLSFNSNVAALGVQRRLGETSSRLSTSFERLSTGLRINRASDDAAGLAIADQLRTNARLLGAATRNVNDGVSLLSIIGGTLSEQSNTLLRLIELAEQSANGTLSSAQRGALQEEYGALVNEFGRLGESTSFNGLNLLLGSARNELSEILIQAGITGGADSALSIETADTGSFSGNVTLGTLRSHLRDSTTFDSLAQYFNNRLGSVTFTDDSGAQRDLLFAFGGALLLGQGTLGVQVGFYQRTADTGGVGAQSGAGANGEVTDASHEWVFAGIGLIEFDLKTGKVTEGFASATLTFEDHVLGTVSVDLRGLTFDSRATTDVINFTGVENTERALNALTVLRARLESISKLQGDFGALESRLQSALSVLGTSREDTAAAESRIRDIDVAEESASLLASQIRQQAGAAVLTQANNQPQLLLFLLED